MWFRQDLRLSDNPALSAAVEAGDVLPVYILDDGNAGEYAMGGASRWWLHQSLATLNADIGGGMRFYHGNPLDVLTDLIAQTGAGGVYWNRCYEPWRIARDKDIKATLKDRDLDVQSFNGSLLWEPHQVLKEDGTPYKVFTPYYKRGCLDRAGEPREPMARPDSIDVYQAARDGAALDDLGLMPDIAWHSGMAAEWTPGEAGARARLDEFLESGLKGYKEDRNRPDLKNVSRLSAHLHFGEISPNFVWHASCRVEVAEGLERDGGHFRSELGWREFSHSLLYHYPDLPRDNLQKKFDHFPWNEAEADVLRKWQRGQTGYPIVDAGMRELWQTGWMHNRVRMIVGSFLVKHLMLHWHHGECWFWDTLVDADLANNSASWQWIAGCGADAAPYFRIFNPITQATKFDPNGDYIRKYVPELTKLPNKYLGAPWGAPADVLDTAGIKLGRDYPKPMVDHRAARDQALEAFSSLKGLSFKDS